jgi:MarR family transcriptional regulator, organic hydroperoxide resistance regulator
MAPTPLQRELRQRRPFKSSAQEALLSLVRTTDCLGRTLAHVIEPHGITRQQFNVLRILRGALPEALPTLEIGERMVEQTPGITRLLDRLEAKGLVGRKRCPDDRRQVHCRITDAGLDLLAKLDQPVLDAEGVMMGVIGRGGQRQLVTLLDQLRAAQPPASRHARDRSEPVRG